MSERIKVFTQRNLKELLRDPLSYFLCLGFPIIMLIVMSCINKTIPPEANMTVFNINNLFGGIAVFGHSFLMIFSSLIISKDRSGAFLRRLYASPMKPSEYISGYMTPMLIIAAAQTVITAIIAYIIGVMNDYTFDFAKLALSLIVLIPSAITFISMGLLFGSLLSDKAAPGLGSLIISLCSFLGGIFMDLEAMGGTMLKICNALPFYNAVKSARFAVNGSTDEIVLPIIITAVYAAVIFVLAAYTFGKKMKSDLK